LGTELRPDADAEGSGRPLRYASRPPLRPDVRGDRLSRRVRDAARRHATGARARAGVREALGRERDPRSARRPRAPRGAPPRVDAAPGDRPEPSYRAGRTPPSPPATRPGDRGLARSARPPLARALACVAGL